MAAVNKECLVIIIDVREGKNKNFKDEAIKIASGILKEKICGERKDLITFLLMGTERTENSMNTKCPDDYKNIVEYSQFQNPTWKFFCSFHKAVNNETPGNKVDWLDSLIVGLDILKENKESVKCPHRRVFLFHDFDGTTEEFGDFQDIANAFVKNEVELIAVSSRIAYKTNEETGTPQAVFRKYATNTRQEEDERFALRLVSDCNAKLCNFETAFTSSHRLSNKRPWTWHGKLTIGSEISISISGFIAIKDDVNIKLKKCWGEEDELASRELRTYVKGVEMEPLDVDMINGYMLGATPIAFDESLEDMEEDSQLHQPGLQILGFPKLNTIPEEYYTGDSLYWIVHRKGMSESAKKLDALVQALLSTERAMLCWKVYSVKYNNPKLVVLLPNEMLSDRPASLAMIELSYHAQHHYWDFPTLCTEKTKCSQTQLDAIDNLIDSMDLMLEKTTEPRQTYESDLLAFNTLPHIFERNFMDILERKVLSNATEDEEQFQKMLAEKNFVEVFWKVPEANEEKAKQAVCKIRELFPLEKSTQPLKNKVDPLVITSENKDTANVQTYNKESEVQAVGSKTPDEDFEILIKHKVLPLRDNTIRDKQFNVFAKQMRSIIWDLIFKSPPLEYNEDKIAASLHVYRSFCLDFNAFIDYNEWIEQVKEVIQTRKDLHSLWQNVIVSKNLSLCFVGQLTLEERVKMDDFNQLNFVDSGINTPASEEM